MKNEFSLYSWCSNCKSVCCERAGELVLTKDELKKIEKFTNKKLVKYKNRNLKEKIKFPIIPSPKGKCVFYSKGKKKCLIQNVKPIGCVGWPVCFYFDFEDKKIVWFRDELCYAKLTNKYFKLVKKILMNKFIRKVSVRTLALHQTIEVKTKHKFKIISRQSIPKDIIPKIKKVEELINMH